MMETSNALVAFNPKAVATFGNEMLQVIVQHEDAKQEAEQALRQAEDREKIIDFELTRVALYLHQEEKIDLYLIYDDNKDSSSSLFRKLLVETGVLTRNVNNDTDAVTYEFTDPKLKGMFYFENAVASYVFKPNEDGTGKRTYTEDQVEDHKKRRSRRNALNMRLNRVCKAAIALFEAKATIDDMQVSKNDETGELQAIVTKGPKELMGKSGNVQIHSKSASPVEGATATPTVTGLAKLADKAHKTEPKSKDKTESQDKHRPENADFLAVMNAAIMAVKNKEGEFSADEKQALTNLQQEIGTALKTAKSNEK